MLIAYCTNALVPERSFTQIPSNLRRGGIRISSLVNLPSYIESIYEHITHIHTYSESMAVQEIFHFHASANKDKKSPKDEKDEKY